ncbi:MAG TPA: HipA domain-containing protein, partial [Steroidobacteraceae bacterium]|nr:HipA domain-containing protein [Steroidobacteraceae bacterium]
FGALIANTDRHFGNLAFLDRYDGRFALAPVYDMLPMLFAPQNEQLTERAFVSPSPTSDTLRSWSSARAAAEDYWRRLSSDTRISASFQSIAAGCARSLLSLPRTGAYA